MNSQRHWRYFVLQNWTRIWLRIDSYMCSGWLTDELTNNRRGLRERGRTSFEARWVGVGVGFCVVFTPSLCNLPDIYFCNSFVYPNSHMFVLALTQNSIKSIAQNVNSKPPNLHCGENLKNNSTKIMTVACLELELWFKESIFSTVMIWEPVCTQQDQLQ